MEYIVVSKDMDCGYNYAIYLTRSQAEEILSANTGDIVSLGKDGAYVMLEHDAVVVRQGDQGGTSWLDRRDFLFKLQDQVHNA